MDFLFSDEGRGKIKKGIDTAANAIKVTLGARGRNVIIRTADNRPYITKDGVTVARSIFLKDPVENLGSMLVKEAAIKTVEQAGDGTTTVSVLLQTMVNGCDHYLKLYNYDILSLKKGMDSAVSQALDALKSEAIKVDDLSVIKDIATISANNDEAIGGLLFEAFSKVGKNGIVTVEESKTHDTTLSISEGYIVDRGYVRPEFINNPSKMRCELDDVDIFLAERVIKEPADILPIAQAAHDKKRSLLIIADDVIAGAIEFLIVNMARQGLKVAVVKSPSFGESKTSLMRDIAVSIGATISSDSNGLMMRDFKPSHLGYASKVIVDKNSTVIIGGNKNIPKHIEITSGLEKFVNDSENSAENSIEVDFAKIRLAKIQNNIATIRVGGLTETEMKERKDRIDDAVSAARSAMEEGYVSGGGSTLARISEKIKFSGEDNVDAGISIIKDALLAPMYQIMVNAGENQSVIDSTIKVVSESAGKIGYNAKTGKLENLIDSGVVDPVKVIRSAIENSSSIAGMFLISECVIY